MANQDWDLLINNRYGKPTLIVEIKSKLDTSSEWAAKLRHNLLAYYTLPKTPYFMLVFPDKFYLWIDNSSGLDERQPDYIIEASPILESYFEQAGISGKEIRQESLELIVLSWLEEIIYLRKSPQELDKSQRWLIESGLYNALLEGEIEYEAAA